SGSAGPEGPGTPAAPPAAGANAPANPGPAAAGQPTAGTPPAELQLAKVRDDVPLPLASMLGKPPEVVQAKLGEHQGKGMMRKSCVRFVPQRTFFACDFALQRYADVTGTFAGVTVEYEDGVATALGFDGYRHGSGPFDPMKLVEAVGLELPAPPREDSPAENVRRWSWFNSAARLLLDGRQYRVEVSVVGDDWARSRIDVMLNDPLTEEQKAKILEPANKKTEP
ncbi:MAG TPA: hypothetical protein VIK91_04570, partial [Nannocystis sp.]